MGTNHQVKATKCLLFVDTECDPETSRIFTISWIIAYMDGRIEKSCDYIIKPDWMRNISKARLPKGITKIDIQQKGQAISYVLKILIDDLQRRSDAAIVGHNIDFDLEVIQQELIRGNFMFDINALPKICTMREGTSVCQLAREGREDYKWPTLNELHENLFGETLKNWHIAKFDVESTYRCFFELRKRGMFSYLDEPIIIPVTPEKPIEEQGASVDYTKKELQSTEPYVGFLWIMAVIGIVFVTLLRSCQDVTNTAYDANFLKDNTHQPSNSRSELFHSASNPSLTQKTHPTNNAMPFKSESTPQSKIELNRDGLQRRHNKSHQKIKGKTHKENVQQDIRQCLQLQSNRDIALCVEKYR